MDTSRQTRRKRKPPRLSRLSALCLGTGLLVSCPNWVKVSAVTACVAALTLSYAAEHIAQAISYFVSALIEVQDYRERCRSAKQQ